MSEPNTRPGLSAIGYGLLGIFFGLMSYTSLALANTVLLYPLLLCFLYVKAGWIPVILSATTFAGMFFSMMDLTAALLLGLFMVLPTLITLTAAKRSLPYFTQLKISVSAFGGCTAALLLILGIATKGNLVDAIIGLMDQAMRTMPATVQDAVLSASFADFADEAAKSIPILGNVVRGEYWDLFFRDMRETLLDQLLAQMIKSALTTAFLCSYLTARALRLREQTHEQAFVPISQWSLPGQVTVGVLLTTFAAYLFDSFAANGSVGTFMAMFTIMECVFAVQGVAAWDRMMCAAKATYRRKVITAGAMAVIAPTFLSAIGLCSALFGRHGLLMKMKNTNPPE